MFWFIFFPQYLSWIELKNLFYVIYYLNSFNYFHDCFRSCSIFNVSGLPWILMYRIRTLKLCTFHFFWLLYYCTKIVQLYCCTFLLHVTILQYAVNCGHSYCTWYLENSVEVSYLENLWTSVVVGSQGRKEDLEHRTISRGEGRNGSQQERNRSA